MRQIIRDIFYLQILLYENRILTKIQKKLFFPYFLSHYKNILSIFSDLSTNLKNKNQIQT